MPLPARLRQLAGTAAFWSDYLGDEVFGEPVADLPDDRHLDLPLSGPYSLRIGYTWRPDADTAVIGAKDLVFRNDDGQDFLLGWYDSHSHPHVLRWEEADLIGRGVALRDPDLPHPGIPFLLLARYVASIDGTDHLLGLWLLNAALRSLGVFTDRQIRYRLSTFNKVPAASEWRRVEPHGWVCHFRGKYFWQGGGKTIYSLRQVHAGPPDNWPRFPFDEWNECLRQVEEAVAEGEPGHPKSATADPLPPLSEGIELRYQVTESDAAYATVPALKRALYDAGLGVCYLSGGWSAFEGPCDQASDHRHPNEADEYTVVCHGEPDEVVAVVRRVVAEAGRPDVRLFQRLPYGADPPYRRLVLE